MMHTFLLAVIGVLLTVCATAQATTNGADSITVEVFSAQTVHAISFTPLGTNASLQTCEKCPNQSVLAPFTAKLANGGVQLSSGKHSTRVRLHGSFRISVPNTESSASAAGTWMIEPHGAAIRVLLTIPSERYVAAALNGEAAPDEPIESLKAMAVAMRTFALENSRRHSAEGFSLCDSTHCQALRLGATRDDAERAVRETAGETLWFKQRRASVYYSQNCGGTTEDVSNVWPSVRATYLTSLPDPYCLRHSDAAWHAQFPLDQLNTLFKAQGWHTPAKIDSIRVIKRTPSGRALTLQVNGIGGPASISASSFHFAINRALGWNQIRSDWYELETSDHVLRVKGKGHGHAVGLCQDGAFEMARVGKSYREILAFYFSGTAVRVSAADDGWKSIQGAGWNLRAIDPATLWMEAGNSQWEKARSVFPIHAIPYPTVYAMPSTELYRQTTGEPGWTLASSRGSEIFLQPASILQRNGAMRKTLLHEFLHVLVEQESSSKTPLWLREGLVELLVDGPRQYESFSEVSLTTLNANLSHPPDKVSSQRAHSDAASMVTGLVKHYGFATVRGWLRDGVPNGIASNIRTSR